VIAILVGQPRLSPSQASPVAMPRVKQWITNAINYFINGFLHSQSSHPAAEALKKEKQIHFENFDFCKSDAVDSPKTCKTESTTSDSIL
jgi:hypothetical protein